MILAFKIIVVAVLVVVARLYISQVRTVRRDRLIAMMLFLGLVAAVLFPSTTQWLANRIGIGRGVDLAFYGAFLLLFVVVGGLNARRRDLERAVTNLTRELALLRARPTEKRTSGQD